MRGFGLQLPGEFQNTLKRALGGCQGSGPMAKLDFDQVAFQYVDDACPAELKEPALFVPAVDASKYQDDSPIVENELQGFHGTRSSILPLKLIHGMRSSKRSHGVTGVWMTQ